MTVRRWKLVGQQLDPVITATIAIDGTQVFSGNFVEAVDPGLDDAIIVASGTFELDDTADTGHVLTVTVTTGDALIGTINWDWQYKINALLTEQEKAYLFTGPLDQVVPQAVNDAVAAKGGWGSNSVDNFGFFPGHTWPDLTRAGEVRRDIKVDGVTARCEPNGMLLVHAGSVLTYSFGIPAKPQQQPQ